MGSGIVILLFFQGLCETSIHSAWASSARKKKAPLFACTVCPYWMFGSVAGILGYLINLRCCFWCCFYKGQLAMAICLSPPKTFSYFSIEKYFHCCFYKGQLAIAICLSPKRTFSYFSIRYFHCCFYKGSLLWLYALAPQKHSVIFQLNISIAVYTKAACYCYSHGQ